jgi:hypothetical protein
VWFGGLREDRLWCEAMVGWRWRRYFQAVGRGCQLWTVDVLNKSDLQFCKLDGKDTLITNSIWSFVPIPSQVFQLERTNWVTIL